jgi:GT2 family glycosyltransferase
MKEVSIILVTYNSAAHIQYCMDSILIQELSDYELTVIDNASTDETKTILKNRYPGISFIENAQNYGYSKALNQGITKADAKFILCLNDDIKLNRDFLTNIHKAINSNDDIGAVQPKVLKPDGKTIDTTGIFLSFFRRFYDIGKGQKDGIKFAKQKYVFGASAAGVLYRKEALESVKQSDEYFDEDFFCLVEDIDLSWRMQKKGWRILYYPNAVCMHTRGISGRKDSFTQYLSMRNRYLMMLKNESLLGLFKFQIIFFIYDLWRNLYMLLINTTYFLQASYEIIRLSPKMIKKRHNKNRCLTNAN